jgi:TetR/AcrR family transcriptional repressor of nem operon
MKPECETKCKLLRVAMELIWESSYGSVSVDDICRRAAVNKGSFYHFFPTKAALTVAAMEADWQEKRARLDSTFSPLEPPLERIAGYCRSIYTHQSIKKEQSGKVCGCPHLTLGSELSTQDESIRRKTAEIMNGFVKYFESAVRDAEEEGSIEVEDCHAVAEELFAYSHGLMLQAKVQNDVTPLLGMESGMRRLLKCKNEVALA